METVKWKDERILASCKNCTFSLCSLLGAPNFHLKWFRETLWPPSFGAHSITSIFEINRYYEHLAQNVGVPFVEQFAFFFAFGIFAVVVFTVFSFSLVWCFGFCEGYSYARYSVRYRRNVGGSRIRNRGQKNSILKWRQHIKRVYSLQK